MNYRHAFHAGGFADVIKHIVLVRILTYLHEKPAAFRVIDSHAGAGLYDLTGEESQRTGEWLTGIGRLMQARLSEAALPLVAPYLDIIRSFNPQRALTAYPGSPLIARALLRAQDRLVACEVEQKARKQLINALRRDTQARIVDLDGWVGLPAFVPPNERRGLVLIDPPVRAEKRIRTHGRGFQRSGSRSGRPGFTCCGIRSRAAARQTRWRSMWRPRWPRPAAPANACGWNSASRRRARKAASHPPAC